MTGKENSGERIDRRAFLRTSVAASSGAALGFAGASRVGAESAGGPIARTGAQDMPTGQLGSLQIGRLISGANVFHGYAHSRDLTYVAELMRRYNTEEKLMETLAKLEANGVNAIVSPPREPFLSIIQRYWREHGYAMQFISDCRPGPRDMDDGEIPLSIDSGASAIYVNGAWADRWCEEGREELLGEAVEAIKRRMVPAGIGGHSLEPIVAAEREGYGADFYMKTLHHHDYWSCDASETDGPFGRASWAQEPGRTIAFMREVEKPFIAFKVLAAGAIPAEEGFQYAFENGADFICVGVFDWQIEEDCRLTKRVLSRLDGSGRERPWRA